MNQNIKYLVENILDDFYDDNSFDIMDDFLGYNYFPKTKSELQEIIEYHYKNNIFNLNDIDVSQITDFSCLFAYDSITENKDFDVSHWDVSNGENFKYMFYNCNKVNSDLSKWDVSKGIYFNNMFNECREFNSDLSKWDVSRGNTFLFMFCNCREFNSDLSKWDVSNGIDFSYMFYECREFNSDLSKWNVSNGRKFSNMFTSCYKFNCDLSSWNIDLNMLKI